MKKIRFGKTGLMVSEVGFGAIPIQRLSVEDAVVLMRGCFDLGVNFIDTANGYGDSEEKIGRAICEVPRHELVIATKSGARDKQGLLEHLDLSLKRMGTDYIDVYQHHGISSEDTWSQICAPGGALEGMEAAVKSGKVRFPAFSSHSIPMAIKLMKTEKFYATQLPINFIDDEAAAEAIPLARALDIGFIAMKPFGGGLLHDARLSMKYLAQFEGIVPDPGIEKLSEMQEIIRIVEAREPLTEADQAAMQETKKDLGSTWCHRCEYCQPCPKNIALSLVLNVESIIKRMPKHKVLDFMGQNMQLAKQCTNCQACISRCPYNLNIPKLLTEKTNAWDQYIKD